MFATSYSKFHLTYAVSLAGSVILPVRYSVAAPLAVDQSIEDFGIMAYIPPHKRSTKDSVREGPSPAELIPRFRKNLSIGSPKSSFEKRNVRHNKVPGVNIMYANTAVSRWFAVGSTSDDVLPSTVSLQQVPLGSVKHGERPLVLVYTEASEVGGFLTDPWRVIAENVVQDLLSSFQVLKTEIESEKLVDLKPALIARFGKVMFHRKQPFSTESNGNDVLSQSILRNLKKSFYTNIPSSYADNISTEIAQEINLDAEEKKETYHIKLSDKEQPDATISCKCKVTSDGRSIELYKIELNQVRHAVMDISCLPKTLDLRLMLCTKRKVTNISDDEKCSIQDLISSAVLDSNVKGGLRWPLGKDCSVDSRYRVVGVWHTKSESFKNSNIRLRVRSADRFYFQTSDGDFSREVVLKLTGIISKMKEPNIAVSSLLEVLADCIKVMWNHFLHCDNFLNLDTTSSS